jgi:very-short-patch-repair endonuclease
MAAQLHFHDRGFLSAWTAARLLGLRRMPTNSVHVTLPEAVRATTPKWIKVAHSSWFDATLDVDRSKPLHIATPLRMLFGLAAELNQFRFERAAEDAWHLGLITPLAAAEYLEQHRCRGKNGVSTIERWLARALPQQRPAQSGLEQELLRAIEAIGMPTPVRQHPVELLNGETIHIDIAWPDLRLGLEPGSSWWHGGDLGQRRDQARDRACSEIGWQIVRFDESLTDDPDQAARQVLTIISERRRTIRNS